MSLLLYIVLILFSFFNISSSVEIRIGALFDKYNNAKDNFSEIALKYAVENIVNETRNSRENFQLSYKVLHIEPNNPFQALQKTCELLEHGVVAILGPQNTKNFIAVQSVCDSKEIPVIQTKWSSHPQRKSNVINNYPHPPVLARAYMDFLKLWNWKKFAVLYDQDESLSRLNEIFTLTLDRSYMILVRHLDPHDTQDYRPSLKEIADTDITHLFIDCRIEYLQDFLQQCQQMGLMNKRYNYFINNLDTHILDLWFLQYSQTNITSLRLMNNINKHPKAKEALCVSYYEEDFFSECFLRTSYSLIIDGINLVNITLGDMKTVPHFQTKKLSCASTDSWEYGLSLMNIMRTKTFEGMSGVNKFDNEGYRSDVLLEVVELQENGQVPIGNWTLRNGYSLTRLLSNNEDPESESLANMNFTVQITLTKPYGFRRESTETLYGNDRYEGFAIDLIKSLAEMEHFNYTFVLREDNDNGSKDPVTGKWSGMLGDLINGTTDLAITDLTINSQRAEAVDFTSPFMNLGIAILFQKPKQAEPNFFSFADPFSYDTWIGLFSTYLFVGLSMYLLGRLCPSEWTNPYPCIEEPEYLVNQFTLPNSYWFATGCLMQQGSEIAPIATATRIIGTMWMFLICILVASYTANLAACLATENPEKLFTDVNSLVENAKLQNIRFGAKKNGATFNFFKNSKKPVYQKIYDHMKAHSEDMVRENDDGVALAAQTQYALFMENTGIDYEIQRHCNLEMYGDLLDNKGYGIAMRKHSPYRSRLSSAILKLQSTGVIDELKRKWWQEKRGGGQCVVLKSTEATPLGMKHVEGVFIVTLQGLCLGLLMVFIEKLINIIGMSKKSRISFWHVLKHEMTSYVDFENMSKPVLKSANNANNEG